MAVGSRRGGAGASAGPMNSFLSASALLGALLLYSGRGEAFRGWSNFTPIVPPPARIACTRRAAPWGITLPRRNAAGYNRKGSTAAPAGASCLAMKSLFDDDDELSERLLRTPPAAGPIPPPNPAAAEDAPAASGGEGSVDWDSAWAAKQKELATSSSTEQTQDPEREQVTAGADGDAPAPEPPKRDRPAFAGRKEVLVTGNAEEGYVYTEIDASGRRSTGGDDGGIGLFDDPNDSRGLRDARRQIMDREERLVESVAFDQVFVVAGSLLMVLLAFMINVYMTGGISNGATRFKDVDMPQYGQPPAIPAPSNQIIPGSDDLVV